MSNQISVIGLGTDISKLAGYTVYGGARLGRVDLVMENVGDNTATLTIKEFAPTWDGLSASSWASNKTPSGTQTGTWTTVVANFTIGARATKTTKLVVVGKTLGIFGSGNTTVNVTPILRNPANLRGAQFDIIQPGRAGFGFETGFDQTAFTG